MSPRSFLASSRQQRGPQPPSHPQEAQASLPPSPLPRFDAPSRYDESSAVPTRIASNSISSAADTMATNRSHHDIWPAAGPKWTGSSTSVTRSYNPTSPVQIPVKQKPRETTKHTQKHQGQHGNHGLRGRPWDVHSREAIPPSVAALLAITSIPAPRVSRSMHSLRGLRPSPSPSPKQVTVEPMAERSRESEKDFSWPLGSRDPMEVLLSPPEDDIDDVSVCESTQGSEFSRTVSMESMLSLSDSFTTDTASSMDMPSPVARGRKLEPLRLSLEPLSCPPGEKQDHPLSEVDIDRMDFRVFEEPVVPTDKKLLRKSFIPLRSAFKSNLTASLRALRQAARSFSTLNFPSIPPEDFLTRSILTIDPQVPFTDERRPPPLEEEPTAELRRYLNPTTTARLERPDHASFPSASPSNRTYTASIQMQTYKIHRDPSPTTRSTPFASLSTSSANQKQLHVPGPRQREMRENSDFIRIAVMEMMMRKRGKLDDQRPGRARWALPPRKAGGRPDAVGANGVPLRWIGIAV